MPFGVDDAVVCDCGTHSVRWRPDAPTGKRIRTQFALVNDDDAVDQYELNSLGRRGRLPEGRPVDNRVWIENGDVGVSPQP